MQACSVEKLQERWEAAGPRCQHSYRVSCKPGELDAGMKAHCAELGFGEPTKKTFKIAYEATCSSETGALTIRWRHPAGLRLERLSARACSTIEPAWVREDTALLRPIVGAMVPVAAAWSRDESSEGWDLEWTRDALNDARIEERLAELRYPLVTDDGTGKQWSRRRACEFSFLFARGGDSADRLITSKRSSGGVPSCPR